MVIAKGERFNTYTHLVGAIGALIGMITLIIVASLDGNVYKIVSVSIYGATLFILYSASTLYHGISGDLKTFFQRLDFLAIYLLIAGSYTPFTLVTLHGTWGWSIFSIIWILAIIGIVQEFFLQENRTTSVVLYILMGWMVLVALNPLLDSLQPAGFWWLLAGGILYTVGVIFYVFDTKVPHFHGIWHIFVLAGSTAHYITIAFFVL
ncbi:PAQR family membrane homeostasis protein TrhA [Sulfurimonas sp.]|uniref:PAQR family membrane homeostasis protein TrhA n=1 Tax=Sulfurimonas sp. TaxID=2022749 RepID=UPI003D09DC88